MLCLARLVVRRTHLQNITEVRSRPYLTVEQPCSVVSCYTFYWSHQRTSRLSFWLAEPPGWLPVWSLLRHSNSTRGDRRQLQSGNDIQLSSFEKYLQPNYSNNYIFILLYPCCWNIFLLLICPLMPGLVWWMFAKIPLLLNIDRDGSQKQGERISIICWQTILFSPFVLTFLSW